MGVVINHKDERRACFGFFFSSRRRHTRCSRDWSSDVCSSDLTANALYCFRQGLSCDELARAEGFHSDLRPSALHCRSEEHTSELQSRLHLVCRLLLEKKKN